MKTPTSSTTSRGTGQCSGETDCYGGFGFDYNVGDGYGNGGSRDSRFDFRSAPSWMQNRVEAMKMTEHDNEYFPEGYGQGFHIALGDHEIKQYGWWEAVLSD